MHPKNPIRWLWMSCFLIGVPSAHASESTSTGVTTVEQVTKQANEMYQQANSLYLNHQFAEAYELYKAAWALRPNYKIAGNLGNCEYELRKYRDAAEHLALALRENPETGTGATRTYFEERLADASRYVGTIEVAVDNAAVARLSVDDDYVGNWPQSHRIYVDPGKRVIWARNDIAVGSIRIEIKKGEERHVMLHILPPPAPISIPVETMPISTNVGVVGAGISVAVIGGGIYMAVAESSNSAGAPRYPQLWAPIIAGSAIGLVSLGILFGSTKSKQTPVKVSGTIVPMPQYWHVGIRAHF